MKLRKSIVLLLSLFILVAFSGCESTGSKVSKVDSTDVVETEEPGRPTQAELNEKMKAEAIEANFIDLNGDKVRKDTRLHLQGTVSYVMGESIGSDFTLTQEEGNGYGMYNISLYTLDYTPIEGDIVDIWGIYSGERNESGMNTILATIIEKK